MYIDQQILTSLDAINNYIELHNKNLKKSPRVGNLCKLLQEITSIVKKLNLDDYKKIEDFLSPFNLATLGPQLIRLINLELTDLKGLDADNALTTSELSFLAEVYNQLQGLFNYCNEGKFPQESLFKLNYADKILSYDIKLNGPDKTITVCEKNKPPMEIKVQNAIDTGLKYISDVLKPYTKKNEVKLLDTCSEDLYKKASTLLDIEYETSQSEEIIKQLLELQRDLNQEILQFLKAQAQHLFYIDDDGKKYKDIAAYPGNELANAKETLAKLEQLIQNFTAHQNGKKEFEDLCKPKKIKSYDNITYALSCLKATSKDKAIDEHNQGFEKAKQEYQSKITPQIRKYLTNQIEALNKDLVTLKPAKSPAEEEEVVEDSEALHQQQITECKQILAKYQAVNTDNDMGFADDKDSHNDKIQQLQQILDERLQAFESYRNGNIDALSNKIEELDLEKQSLLDFNKDDEVKILRKKVEKLKEELAKLKEEEGKKETDRFNKLKKLLSTQTKKSALKTQKESIVHIYNQSSFLKRDNASQFYEIISSNSIIKPIFTVDILKTIRSNLDNIQALFSTTKDSESITNIQNFIVTVSQKTKSQFDELVEEEAKLSSEYSSALVEFNNNKFSQGDTISKINETEKQLANLIHKIQQKKSRLSTLTVEIEESKAQLKKLQISKLTADINAEYEKASELTKLDLSETTLESSAETITAKKEQYLADIKQKQEAFNAKKTEINTQREEFNIEIKELEEEAQQRLQGEISNLYENIISYANDYTDQALAKLAACQAKRKTITSNTEEMESLITEVAYSPENLIKIVSVYRETQSNSEQLKAIQSVTEEDNLEETYPLQKLVDEVNPLINEHNKELELAKEILEARAKALKKEIKEFDFSTIDDIDKLNSCLQQVKQHTPEIITGPWMINALKQIGKSENIPLVTKKQFAKEIVNQCIDTIDSLEGLNELVSARRNIQVNNKLNYIFEERDWFRFNKYGNTATWESIMGKVKDRIVTLAENDSSNIRKDEDYQSIMSVQRGRGFLMFHGKTRYENTENLTKKTRKNVPPPNSSTSNYAST